MVHMWFPVMLLGLYVYRIVKKESYKFTNFLTFHILMHISLISFVALLFVYIVNPVYHPIQIGILILNLYSIYHSYLTYCIVFIQLVFSQKCCNILLSIMFFMFLRAAFFATVIVVLKESGGDILEFDFLETVLLLLNFITLISVGARWKWKIDRFKDPNINQISAANFVNSTVSLGFCMLFQLLTLFKFSVNFKSTFPLTSDKLITNIYYLPFLWILSSIITHLPPIQTWIKKYDVGEEPEVPQLQMTQISVERNLEVAPGNENSSVPYSTLEEINISA